VTTVDLGISPGGGSLTEPGDDVSERRVDEALGVSIDGLITGELAHQ
jgi:hypothetical protein